ncbi:hypothetical protein ACSQ67_015113 [Phaseolus vulgaris]
MRCAEGTSLFIGMLLSNCPSELPLITKLPHFDLNYSITLPFYYYLPKVKMKIFPLLSFSWRRGLVQIAFALPSAAAAADGDWFNGRRVGSGTVEPRAWNSRTWHNFIPSAGNDHRPALPGSSTIMARRIFSK